MDLFIYNSFTRKKEKFNPITAGKVGMYVCGPTVYNHAHIGNARPVIFYDMMKSVQDNYGFYIGRYEEGTIDKHFNEYLLTKNKKYWKKWKK